MKKRILLFCLLWLSACQPKEITLTANDIRATKQAFRQTQSAEKTLHPNQAPEQAQNLTSEDLPSNGNLSFSVADSDNKLVSTTVYLRKQSAYDQKFTIIALPDTQFYAMDYPEIGLAQTRWIMENREKLNIVAVAHLGDSVHMGEDLQQWSNANEMIETLGTELPFGISVGNHDQVPLDDPEGASTANYNQYFGVNTFSSRPYYGGHFGENNDNSYILFSAGDLEFVMLFLESDDYPNREVIDWAEDVLQEHNDRIGILVVHSLLYADASWTTEGRAIYQRLMAVSNLHLMLGGHIPGEAHRTDTYDDVIIHSILSDYQEDDLGGNGMLRILTFDPASNKMSVQTYSPNLDQYQADEDSQFSLPFDLNTPFTRLAVLADQKSGDPVLVPYQGLEEDSVYDWYVEVSDGVSTVKSAVWSFTTH